MIPYHVMKDLMAPGYEARQRERYEALCKALDNAMSADLGDGPAADYGKGSGSWTGD